jgi:hypothetical protein
MDSEPKLHIGFDGLTFPIDENAVIVEAEKGPIEGAGITWETFDGHLSVTVEFKARNQEPIYISLIEDDDGHFEVVTPPVVIIPDIQQKED